MPEDNCENVFNESRCPSRQNQILKDKAAVKQMLVVYDPERGKRFN